MGLLLDLQHRSLAINASAKCPSKGHQGWALKFHWIAYLFCVSKSKSSEASARMRMTAQEFAPL